MSNPRHEQARRQAFVRACRDLVESEKVRCHEGQFWIPKPTRTDRTKPDITGHLPEMSGGCREGRPDITGHISLDMSGNVWSTDNPDMEGWQPDFEANCGIEVGRDGGKCHV